MAIKRRGATGISNQIRRALDRWMAQAQRVSTRRTPAKSRARVAELRASMGQGRADESRQDTEKWLDEPRDSKRRGRGKSPRSLALIEAASRVLAEIQPASVRAVCYRLFTMGLIASMAKNATNRVSAQLTFAREQQLIPWSWIVDETREPERVSAWADPAAYVETVKRAYRRDRWTEQPDWIEVWSEKGTVRGTLAPVLHEYGVTFRVNHGYGSATSVYQAATDSLAGEKVLTVLYVGDWHPSGLHMSEVDLPRRLHDYGGEVLLHRLALITRDTQSGGLPSFLAETKRKDPRYRWYLDRYGPRCWELDALSPVILRERVEQAIRDRLDLEAWNRAEIVEQAERDSLTTILSTWRGISGQAPKYDEGQP